MDFMEEFQHKIVWDTTLISIKRSEEFIRRFRSKLNILDVLLFQKHLSSELLEELINIHTTIKTNEDCSICIDKSKDPVITNKCKLIFCKLCIDTWLIDHPKCPLCRTELF